MGPRGVPTVQAPSMASGPAARTPTATTTLTPGRLSVPAPAPMPAPSAGVFRPSSTMNSVTPTSTWSTQALGPGPKWPPPSLACPKWPVTAVPRTWWRTFWITSTCSHPRTHQWGLPEDLDPTNPHPPRSCRPALVTPPTARQVSTSRTSKTIASVSMARRGWAAFPPCQCRPCQKTSPVLVPGQDPWASLTVQQGCWKSFWHLTARPESSCPPWTLSSPSQVVDVCCRPITVHGMNLWEAATPSLTRTVCTDKPRPLRRQWTAGRCIPWPPSATVALPGAWGASNQPCRCLTEAISAVGEGCHPTAASTAMDMAAALDWCPTTSINTWRSCQVILTACLWSASNATWNPFYTTPLWTENRWTSTLTPWPPSRGTQRTVWRPPLIAGCLGRNIFKALTSINALQKCDSITLFYSFR